MKLKGFYVHNIPKRYSWNMVLLVVLLLMAVLRPVQPEDGEHFGPFSEVRKNYISFLFSSSIPLPKKEEKKWLSSNLDCTTLLLCSLYFGMCVPLARLLEQNQRKVRPKRDRLVRRMERERREEGEPTYPPPINNGVCTVSKTLDGYTGSMGMAPLMGTLRSCIWLLNVGTSVAYLKSESHKEHYMYSSWIRLIDVFFLFPPSSQVMFTLTASNLRCLWTYRRGEDFGIQQYVWRTLCQLLIVRLYYVFFLSFSPSSFFCFLLKPHLIYKSHPLIIPSLPTQDW